MIDPGVELLPDVPIVGPEADLFGRRAIGERVVELATALPVDAPRAIALTGGSGAGKTSVVRIATALLAERADCALIMIDAAIFPGAQPLLGQLVAELTRFFRASGAVDASDSIRDTLSGYGDFVSSVARFAGVKVDVGSAVRRSADSVRTEIAAMAQEVGKRLVILIDHVDRLGLAEITALLGALRFYSEVPYFSVVIALDRRDVALRATSIAGGDRETYERLIDVELALPPVDRILLARLIAGGLARVTARTGRDTDDVLHHFDPDGGVALDLIETPRDAVRAVNALAAALPLVPATADLADAGLDLVLRLLVPELDTARLDARTRLTGEARLALADELSRVVAGHRRGPAAQAALRALIG
jgi:hypothetical protein